MIEKRFIRPFIKITVITICVLAVLLTSFHFWFRDHAEEVIEELVNVKSNGKVNLKLKNFRYNYFSSKMELQNAVFFTTDSLDAPTAYRFKISKIKIELQSLWQLVFNGKLYISSLTLITPDIQAIRMRPAKNADEKEISISQEMGRIYNSIRDGLKILDAKRFLIEEGTFSVINKIEADKLPITISHIHFLVDNNQMDSLGNVTTKHPDPDNMILRTHNQDIDLPDGRHRISFRNLRINIKRQSIEMDSCTIAAEKSDTSRAAFSLFFDTLRMSSVDFGALYRKDLINADTVYCTKPQIKLVIGLKDKNSIKKNPPSLKEIIQPLTGDLQLGYVAIVNADIDIITTRNDHTTTFTSRNDNIEITGLHINSDSSEPLAVKNFLMTIRDYETLSRDSTLAFRFDSIQFTNGKVVLSNFIIKTLPGKRSSSVDRYYSIPKLELSNLSWGELLFNRNVKAGKAVLYNPVVNYKRLASATQNKKLTLFRDLGNIDAITELQQLQVINGQLNMQLDQRTKITLQDANINVSSNELLGSKNIKSIQRSFNQLRFVKGVLTINDLKAELHNVHFTGKDEQLEADEVIVYDPTKILSAVARDVVINELYYNDSTKSISVDGLEWQQATVNLGAFPKQSKPSKSSITIKNISGNSTTLVIQNPAQTISTVIRSLSADELRKPANEKTSIYGLRATGNNFNLVQKSLWVETDSYDINDGKLSFFNNTCVQRNGVNSTFTAILANISFVPDIPAIMKGKYDFDKMMINEPLIHFKKTTGPERDTTANELPDVSIADLTIKNPVFYLENTDSTGSVFMRWKETKNNQVKNEWHLKDIRSNGEQKNLSAKQLMLDGQGLAYTDSKGKHFGIDSGYVHAEAENIQISIMNKRAWDWSANIKNALVKNLNHFAIKNKGVLILKDASGEDINISSSNLKNVSAFIEDNPLIHVNNSGGSYTDSINSFNWINFSFNQYNKTLSVDSFAYKPILDRDSFVSIHPYQVDYITTTTGKIYLSNASPAYFVNDSIFKAGKLLIEGANIDVYRDATKPFLHGRLKPLPSIMIQKIPPFFSLDTIQLADATVTYTQVDKKTEKTGTIPITHLNATLSPVRNYELDTKDSLVLNVQGLVMNKMPVTIHASESYEDSLAGFSMHLNVKETDLTILNPVLVPLLSAKLKSGHVDSMNMQVTANEYAAYGEMKMNCSNLKIVVLKKGDEKNKTLLTRIAGFAANAFLLKHKNKNKRTGIVYFERNRERSFFNYLVKMTISGVAYSAGLKKNKKEIRRYRRENNIK